MRRVLVGIVIALCLPSPVWAKAKKVAALPPNAAAPESPSASHECRGPYRRALLAQHLAIFEGDPDRALEAALRAQDAFQTCLPLAPAPREVENEYAA